MKARVRNDSLDLTKLIWDLCLMNTLHCEFGFGEKRIKQFYEKLEETQRWFMDYSCTTDKRQGTYTNMETAIIRLINDLDGIDWKTILNVEGIILGGKDIIKVADICKRR